jgi:hypothetical protein
MESLRWPDASGAQERRTRCSERCRSPAGAQAMPLLCLFTLDGEHDSRASNGSCRSRTLARTHRPPNGSHAKLCGRSPRSRKRALCIHPISRGQRSSVENASRTVSRRIAHTAPHTDGSDLHRESAGTKTPPSPRLSHREEHVSARLTDLTLSCAAKAHVPKPERRGGCRA